MTDPAGLLPPSTRTWILSNGNAGYEVQGLGVAEALGVEAELKRVAPTGPCYWFAPWGPAQANPDIAPPWPDLLIAAGRQAIPYARMIRRHSQARTFVAILQNPQVNPARFDFVWAPRHDRLTGPNVLSTLLSPHRVTKERLAAEAAHVETEIAHLPRPRVAVLLGGNNAVYRLTPETASRIGAQLAGLTEHFGASLMVTPSRRTGETEAGIIRRCLEGKPAIMWNGEAPNPYFGYLGNADAVVVTCDSVNMVGEATATGKPVYVIELEPVNRRREAKFRRFLDGMYAHGAARPFAGQLEHWEYEPLNATKEIAEAIARAVKARTSSASGV